MSAGQLTAPPPLPSELERLSGLVGRPSESHPLHNSGLLSLDPVQDKTPLYSQLLQAYKWSNKVGGATSPCTTDPAGLRSDDDVLGCYVNACCCVCVCVAAVPRGPGVQFVEPTVSEAIGQSDGSVCKEAAQSAAQHAGSSSSVSYTTTQHHW